MIGGRNIHHKNFNVESKPVEEKVEVKVEEKVDEPVREQTREETSEVLNGMTKNEQVDYLVNELGVSTNDVKKLKYEKDRVDKILEILFN